MTKSTLRTARFGAVNFTAGDIVEFPWGLPGFEGLRRFLALSAPQQPGVVWLQSAEDAAVSFEALDPYQFVDGYEFRLPPHVADALALHDSDNYSVLCIVNRANDRPTINLLAPIVVNVNTRRARQVVLEQSTFSTHEPLMNTQGASQRA